MLLTNLLLPKPPFSSVSAFAFFQFYCFESGSNAIPNFFSNNNLTSVTDLQSFLNSSEQIAAAGCQFTNPLRDFFASNAPWFQYQKETWLAGGLCNTHSWIQYCHCTDAICVMHLCFNHIYTQIQTCTKRKDTWHCLYTFPFVLGIVFLVIFLIILIAIILLGKKIRISTQIIKEAAK